MDKLGHGATEIHKTKMLETPPLFQLACVTLADYMRVAQHFVIDVDVLPNNHSLSDFKLPYDIMLIGLESEEFSGEEFNTNTYAQLVDALFLVKDDEGIHVHGFRSIDGKGKEWLPGANITTIYLNEEDEEVRYGADMFPGYKNMDREPLKEASEATVQMINDIVGLLNCSNVSTAPVKPSNLRMMRARKHRLPLKEYNEIKLPGEVRLRTEHKGGTHASPAYHMRRGHKRTLHRGTRYERDIFVHACAVGNPQRGKVEHDYVVRHKDEA